MKSNKEIAETLDWLVVNGHIPGLMPETVMEAGKRLLKQEERVAELEAILSAHKHTVSVEIADGQDPYSKEIRVRIDIVDPRPYYADHLLQEYQLLDAQHDYLEHVARRSLRMASGEFENALMPQAMAAVHKAVQKAMLTHAK